MNDKTNFNTGDMNTGNWNTGCRNTGDGNTGNGNTGNGNTGCRNTGDGNTGNWNVGKRNTGNWNTGYLNSGHWNTGNWNTGDVNTGNRNNGNGNAGDWNVGNVNSGDYNTGSWNAGNYNTGYLNTTDAPVRIFNKETDVPVKNINFPRFFYFRVTEWVPTEAMTEDEKRKHPKHESAGGFLKKKDYKEAFRESYNNASEQDRALVKKLPNFDPEIFYEISGIDLREPSSSFETKTEPKIIEIDGKKYHLVEVEGQ